MSSEVVSLLPLTPVHPSVLKPEVSNVIIAAMKTDVTAPPL